MFDIPMVLRNFILNLFRLEDHSPTLQLLSRGDTIHADHGSMSKAKEGCLEDKGMLVRRTLSRPRACPAHRTSIPPRVAPSNISRFARALPHVFLARATNSQGNRGEELRHGKN